MANIYKSRIRGRGTTVAGSAYSEGITGNLVGISWPGATAAASTMRHSTGSWITFSVSPGSSEQYFFEIKMLNEKTTGMRWYPGIQTMNTSGDTPSPRFHGMLPLVGDRIKMNWAASTHKNCGHLDMDLIIDGPPGLEGSSW